MNKNELTTFERTLRTRQSELSDLRHNREALTIEPTADEFDRIQFAQERDFAMGTINRESTRLREIRAALQRIHNGSFGICVNCEEEISAKRLVAVPWTPLCISCQETEDRLEIHSHYEDAHLVNAA
jgi:RNA polymerase-binding transcription factor